MSDAARDAISATAARRSLALQADIAAALGRVADALESLSKPPEPAPSPPGATSRFWLLRCQRCDAESGRPLSIPFASLDERGDYAAAHASSGHTEFLCWQETLPGPAR